MIDHLSSEEPDLSTELGEIWNFDGLYQAKYADSVRMAYFLTGSMSQAEEATQDAFVRLLERWSTVDNPAAYLRLSVINRCRSWHRSRPASSASTTALNGSRRCDAAPPSRVLVNLLPSHQLRGCTMTENLCPDFAVSMLDQVFLQHSSNLGRVFVATLRRHKSRPEPAAALLHQVFSGSSANLGGVCVMSGLVRSRRDPRVQRRDDPLAWTIAIPLRACPRGTERRHRSSFECGHIRLGCNTGQGSHRTYRLRHIALPEG
jgi:Sigma-70 region 2